MAVRRCGDAQARACKPPRPRYQRALAYDDVGVYRSSPFRGVVFFVSLDPLPSSVTELGPWGRATAGESWRFGPRTGGDRGRARSGPASSRGPQPLPPASATSLSHRIADTGMPVARPRSGSAGVRRCCPGFLADPYPELARPRSAGEVHRPEALGMVMTVSHRAASAVPRHSRACPGLDRRLAARTVRLVQRAAPELPAGKRAAYPHPAAAVHLLGVRARARRTGAAHGRRTGRPDGR